MPVHILKSRISNLYVSASQKYETGNGDIIQQDFNVNNKSEIVLNNFLNGMISLFLFNSCNNIINPSCRNRSTL